jgi:hypothetical protein
MATRFATPPPTDNCPQPKEAQPLSQLDIQFISHFDSSALWFEGPEAALIGYFPILYYPTHHPQGLSVSWMQSW